MTFAALTTGTTDGHPLIQQNVVPDLGGFADHDPHAMINEQPLSDSGPGMNFDAGEKSRKLRNEPSCDKPTFPVKPVRHPVQHDGMQARVAKQDFPATFCGGVLLLDRPDVIAQ